MRSPEPHYTGNGGAIAQMDRGEQARWEIEQDINGFFLGSLLLD